MKRLWTAMIVPLAFFGASAFADGHIEAGKAVFEENCADCHYEDDFAGESKDDIMALINGVVGGEVEHKADLSGLSEEDLSNVAAYFASFE